MQDQSTKLLDHCVKGAQMGVVALGQMLPYCAKKETYAFVEESAVRYRDYAVRTSAAIQKSGKKPKHIGKISVWCAVKVVKWRCKHHGGDNNILDQVRDGAVKSIAACERYMKMYAGASRDALASCSELADLSRDVQERSYLCGSRLGC